MITAPPGSPADLLEEIRHGRRVILAARDHAQARRLWFEGCRAALTREDRATVYRARGMERITHPSGGWVRFGSRASGMWRGLVADTLAVPDDATEAQMAALVPAILTSADPRVIKP